MNASYFGGIGDIDCSLEVGISLHLIEVIFFSMSEDVCELGYGLDHTVRLWNLRDGR